MTTRYIFFFFFNDTATTEIYTLSLHDALPIFAGQQHRPIADAGAEDERVVVRVGVGAVQGCDRPEHGHREAGHTICPSWKIGRSTRLNSSHANISYAVFCLKKKHK